MSVRNDRPQLDLGSRASRVRWSSGQKTVGVGSALARDNVVRTLRTKRWGARLLVQEVAPLLGDFGAAEASGVWRLGAHASRVGSVGVGILEQQLPQTPRTASEVISSCHRG